MLSVHRYHEISESTHRVLNPLSIEKLELVGDICSFAPDQRLLDLGSGKGEMLCQFAERHRIGGLGIDIFEPLVAVARERAEELGVADRVAFELGDAADFDPGASFDAVASIGTSWIGGGLVGTLELMWRFAAPGARFLMGDVYWEAEPSPETRAMNEHGQQFGDLGTTLEWIEAAGFELVEMVLANRDEWDRYAASQWANVERWSADNPDDPDADEVRVWRDRSRRAYMVDERRCLGWGVFVLNDRMSTGGS